MPRIISTYILFLLVSLNRLPAQPSVKYASSDIGQAIKKLNVLGSVLYIAAHPDDENTRLITWLSKEKLYTTAYLSLTRGDGGQNLIGPELNDLLGVIRTQELLAARRIDGGNQFFSRARDFGFSKNPDETFEVWNREQVLADMVWVIRKFRPDVMITRFNTVPGRTHGHHTASAILAEEAFEAAADKERFPEQLQYVDVWQPKRLMWNTNAWFYASEKDFKTENLLKIDVGQYNEVLGKSYTEIAAESRSMHKSQGFGSSGTRGSSLEYLEHTKGSEADSSLFEGITVSWQRVPGGEKIGQLLDKVYKDYNPEKPSASVNQLLEVRKLITALPEGYWKNVKLNELNEVIKACMGLWIEAIASEYSAVPGQTVKISVEAINRSEVPSRLEKVALTPAVHDTVVQTVLKQNTPATFTLNAVLPKDISYTHPYWLQEKGDKGMFKVAEQQLIGLPENTPAITALFRMNINGQDITFEVPVVYKKTDPVQGEQYRPFEVIPAVFINPMKDLMLFADNNPKSLTVTLRAGKESIDGKLQVAVPQGWKAVPAFVPFNIGSKGEELKIQVEIYPSASESTGEIRLNAITEKDTFHSGLITISYDHIPVQTLLPSATIKVVKVNLRKKGNRIGYLMGVGDEVASALTEIGYDVTILKEEAVTLEQLQKFDAVVLGIRAFNSRERLKQIHPLLLKYVKGGGTVVAQYNTLPSRFGDNRLVTDSIGPYPFSISRDRITKEDAPVEILNPGNPVLKRPNTITLKDFDNWVQERGLYFPDKWSDKYQTVIASNDPGETPKQSGILIGNYGKGIFIYTTYSWFRQLPAGVPGAFRIFVNLISARQ